MNVTHRPVTQVTTRLPVPRAPANHQVVYTTLPAPPAQAPLRGTVMQAPAVRQVNPQNSKRLFSCVGPQVICSSLAFSWLVLTLDLRKNAYNIITKLILSFSSLWRLNQKNWTCILYDLCSRCCLQFNCIYGLYSQNTLFDTGLYSVKRYIA